LKSLTEGTAVISDGTIAVEAALPEPKIDDLGRAYATGKRKNSIARVWIKPGNGKVTVKLHRHLKSLTALIAMTLLRQLKAADYLAKRVPCGTVFLKR